MSGLMLDKSPEMRFLGALLDKPAHEIAMAAVPPEAFSEGRASALYQALLATAGKRSDVRAEDVVAELAERGKLQLVGGAEAVHTLAALHADEPIDAVRREVLREASRRAVQETGLRIHALARDGKMGDAFETLQGAMETVQRFDGAQGSKPWMHVADHLEQFAEQLADIATGKVQSPPTAQLGALTRPLGQPRPGTLVVVGGFSHAGKSFLMQHLEPAYHFAGYPTLRLSLEDGNSVNRPRLVAEVGRFSLSSPLPDRYEAGKALEALLAGLNSGKSAISRDVPRLLETPDSRDLQAILRRIRSAVVEMGVRVVFVDYVQEIDVPSARDPRERIMKAVSALKLEAIRLGITIVLGSQLRKPPAGAKLYEPRPEDLKEASELHHAAEVLILCWREEGHTDERGRPCHVRLGRVRKDKLTGSYPFFQMVEGVGGAVDDLVLVQRGEGSRIERLPDPSRSWASNDAARAYHD